MTTDRAWISVDPAALTHNATVLRRAIPATTRLGIMVKANGYGHGMEVAARAAVAGGADLLMVVSIDEGLRLRAAGIDAPTLVVYPPEPGAIRDAVAADLALSVGGVESVRRTLAAWSDVAAVHADAVLRLHVEVDTGMGRGGIAPSDLLAALEAIEASSRAEVAGIWSHLADGSDPAISAAQVARYDAALAAVAATGRPAPVRHVAATEGLFVGTAPSYDLVRIGIGFYGTLGVGVHADPRLAALAAALRPAMTVAAHPVRLESVAAGTSIGYGGEWTTTRPSRIATIPIGYADGWARTSWPGSHALIRGRRVPLVGRVSMDSVCADVTDVSGATIDDEVVLLGAQGDARITVDEIAATRGTIPNEVFCAFGPRLTRRLAG